MTQTIKQLAEKLQSLPNQDREVEFLICDVNGNLVAVDIKENAGDLEILLNMFSKSIGVHEQ